MNDNQSINLWTLMMEIWSLFFCETVSTILQFLKMWDPQVTMVVSMAQRHIDLAVLRVPAILGDLHVFKFQKVISNSKWSRQHWVTVLLASTHLRIDPLGMEKVQQCEHAGCTRGNIAWKISGKQLQPSESYRKWKKDKSLERKITSLIPLYWWTVTVGINGLHMIASKRLNCNHFITAKYLLNLATSYTLTVSNPL